MKTLKDKHILVASDFAGLPLKNAVVADLEKRGWKVTDVGQKSLDENEPEMFHRIGLKAGAKISEGEFERALIFCGTGTGIHIAASKCPRVHATVVESVASAKRARTGNDCNVLSMGAFYVAPQMGIECARAFLESEFCEGWTDIKNFYEYHKLAYDELDVFDYEKYKANGFEVDPLGYCTLKLEGKL